MLSWEKGAFRSKDDVFTYCIHLGYLAYDADSKTARIPNYEIREEWVNAIEDVGDYKETLKIIDNSRRLLEATWNKDEETVAELLENAHSLFCDSLNYNRESDLKLVIGISYIYAREKYTVIFEMPSGKGFADIVFIPVHNDVPAMIVELKYDKNAESGIKQIIQDLHSSGDKSIFRRVNQTGTGTKPSPSDFSAAKYDFSSRIDANEIGLPSNLKSYIIKSNMQILEHYKGNILAVAVNYDRKKKKHKAKITMM